MTAAARKRQLAAMLIRAVLAVREPVLDRPRLRAALRALGWPVIRLALSLDRPLPAPPPPPVPWAEPVLRLPLDYVPGPLAPAPRIAVLLHAADEEATAAFARSLGHLGVAADLLVSSPKPRPPEAGTALVRGWGGGRAQLRQEGPGGGLGAQLAAYAELLPVYDLALVLRGERAAAGSPEAQQRELVLKTLLGAPALVRAALEAFVQVPRLGVVAPRTAPGMRARMGWGRRYADCRALAEQLGFALFADSPADFPAGGVFWARPAALRPLLEAPGLAAAPPGAAERLIFQACERAGLRWARAGADLNPAAPEEFYRAEMPRGLERAITDCGRAVLPPGRRPCAAPPEAALPAERRKEAFRGLCRAELDAFLRSSARLSLPTSETPAVSIVLLLFNQAELTLQCLRSLRFALDAPCEVIIADNASTDATSQLLDRIDGARIIRNAENLHFLRGVNAAAAAARGRHLLLLNNDTRVTPGSIGAAAGLLDEDASVGAVGGMIELLDGTLQEAGSIVWRDGSCVGFGRGGDPAAPEFHFRREVDYCSGAFLMVRRELFERLGRFDTAFAPAYYEETDLCMRIREAGCKVVYEPRAHISHFEFGSSAGSSAALALQARHQAVFLKRHGRTLARDQQPPGGSPLLARMRGDHAGRVLILEDQIPYPHLGSGYPRALDIIQAVSRAGWFATLFPMSFPDVDLRAAYEVLPHDVEIAAERGHMRLAEFLRERAGYYDAVIVSRPHNMKYFRAALEAAPEFIALQHVIYDAEAVFARRDAARDGLTGRNRDPAADVARETALAAGVGCVFAVNAQEAQDFRARGGARVEVVGHALCAEPTVRPFEGRRDLLFVGAVDAAGSPNSDSLVFFVREVMPRLDALIGDQYTLRVVGRTGAADVRALAGPRVQLLGRIDDLAPLYDSSRIFVAPTRFAGGIPMKIHSAAAAGLPCAVTPLLAAQLGWRHGEELAVGEGADGFAEACRRLYQEPDLWARVRAGALARIADECRPDAFAARIAGALQAVRRPAEAPDRPEPARRAELPALTA